MDERAIPTVGCGPEEIDSWARQQYRRWRAPEVSTLFRSLVDTDGIDSDTRALCLSWLVADGHEDVVHAARVAAGDEDLRVDVAARLGCSVARHLSQRDDPDAAKTLASARLLAERSGVSRARVAPLRVDLELALQSFDPAVIRDGLERFASAAPEDLEPDIHLSALGLRIEATTRLIGTHDHAPSEEQVDSLLHDARSAASEDPPDSLACGVRRAAARLALVDGRWAQSLELARLAMEAAGVPAPDAVHADLRMIAADAAAASGDDTSARQLQEEAVDYAQREGAPGLIAMTLAGRARLSIRAGKFEESVADFEAAAGALEADHQHGAAVGVLAEFGHTACDRGEIYHAA